MIIYQTQEVKEKLKFWLIWKIDLQVTLLKIYRLNDKFNLLNEFLPFFIDFVLFIFSILILLFYFFRFLDFVLF